MEFRKKLKIRLYFAIAYIVIGLLLTVLFNVLENGSEYLSTFGLVLMVVGIARLRNYRRITKTEESVKKQEIMETDERNVEIVKRAKNAAFNVFVILLSIAIIVLQFLDLTVYVQPLFGAMCLLLVIYWVSYWIIRQRS